MRSRACSTHGVVTPNMLAPRRRRSRSCSTGLLAAMPATAAAAFARMSVDSRFRPATSTTLGMSIRSVPAT
jgi:hypothetical protein